MLAVGQSAISFWMTTMASLSGSPAVEPTTLDATRSSAPKCTTLEEMQENVREAAVKIAYDYRSAQTRTQRFTTVDKAGKWSFVSVLPAEGGGLTACVIAQGAKTYKVVTKQIASAFPRDTISCPQTQKAIEYLPWPTGDSVGTRLSSKNALRRTRDDLPEIGRKSRWTDQELQNQTKVIDRLIGYISVPNKEDCLGRKNITVSFKEFVERVFANQGYSIAVLDDVAWTVWEAINDARAIVMAITGQPDPDPVGKKVLIFSLSTSGQVTVVGSGYGSKP